MSQQSEDVEASSGGAVWYETAPDNPEDRWAMMRKVYSILTVELLVAFAFAALVVAVQPVATFFKGPGGLAIYIIVILLAIGVTLFLSWLTQIHLGPCEFIQMGIFTLFFGFIVGLAASFTNAQVLAESVLALAAVVITLFIYTFWTEKRGHLDFSFPAPFLISLVIIVLMFVLFQLFYPMQKVTDIVFSVIFVVIFSAYIVYDTDSLIKRFPHRDFIWAAVCLSYLDVLRVLNPLFNKLKTTQYYGLLTFNMNDM